jgi:iron complex outermembrane recepter protein
MDRISIVCLPLAKAAKERAPQRRKAGQGEDVMRQSADGGLRGALLAGAALLAPAAPAIAQTATEAPAQANDDAIDEIVVTARRREESLQQVPLSVVAVSAEELEARSISNLEDLGQSTPNFTFSETYNGGAAAGLPFIRGVGQIDSHPGYDSPVGIYIDGVYYGRMYGNNLDTMELERIEVLRGPQGTLFGKNTSGGAINIITAQPDASGEGISGRVQGGFGSRNLVDVVTGANIPLVQDTLALRVAGSWSQQDGYAERADGQEMANTDRWSARAQLLFAPTQSFSALLSADVMEFDEANAAYRLADTNPAVGPVAAYNGARDPDYDNRWISANPYTFNATGPNFSRGEIRGVSLTLTADTAFGAFKSITAYRDMSVDIGVDPDGSPVTIIDSYESTDQDQVSQEFQLSGEAFGDRLQWVSGLYYFQEDIVDAQSFVLVPALFGGTRDFSRTLWATNESLAVYGQGTFNITDALRLTAGLRYTEDEKTIQSDQHNYLGALQFLTPLGVHSSSAWSPRVGLDYQLSPDIMVYVSAAQGAKNGGFNGRVGRLSDFTEFQDETVWTYEAGFRSEFWDGRARFNVTAFFSDYEDMQMTISGSTVVGGAPAPFSLITNIPEAQIRGGEVEFVAALTPSLRFTSALGITEGEYTELPTDAQFIAANLIHPDTEFLNMPRVSYTLGLEYTNTIDRDVEMTARIDYAHRSRTELTPENSSVIVQPAYDLFNARIKFEAVSGLSVSLWGTNLTDEVYAVGGGDDATRPGAGLGFAIFNMGPPRTFGVTLQQNF